MCHFLLIPCLKHMIRAHVTSNLVVWHNENKSTPGLVQHATNSKAWPHLDIMWLLFAFESCNVILKHVNDGINPFGEKKNT